MTSSRVPLEEVEILEGLRSRNALIGAQLAPFFNTNGLNIFSKSEQLVDDPELDEEGLLNEDFGIGFGLVKKLDINDF
jgi:hypothetical protein